MCALFLPLSKAVILPFSYFFLHRHSYHTAFLPKLGGVVSNVNKRFVASSTFLSMSNTLTQVYIGNLPLDVDEERFSNVVSENGGEDFVNIRLANDKFGKSRGFGYVDYDGNEKAADVVEAINGIEIDGRTIKADIAPPRTERTRTPPENTVFVGNLSWEATRQGIHDMVNDVMGEGKAVKIRLAIDRNTQRPRGFGYIDFVDAESADRAIELLNGLNLDGRDIRVDRPTKREDGMSGSGRRPQQRNNQNTVFLGNLSWDVTEELLEDMLNDLLGPDQFEKVRMSVDRDTGRMKGYAHVDFVDESGVERAITELNGIELLGRALRVDHAKRADGR